MKSLILQAMTIEAVDPRGRKRLLDYREQTNRGTEVKVISSEYRYDLPFDLDGLYRARATSEDDLEVSTNNWGENVVFSRDEINNAYFLDIHWGSIRWRKTQEGDYPEKTDTTVNDLSTIGSNYEHEYLSLPRTQRRETLSHANLVIYAKNLLDDELLGWVDSYRKRGLPIVSFLDVASVLLKLADRKGLDLPDFDPTTQFGKSKVAKEILHQQDEVVRKLTSGLRMSLKDNTVGFAGLGEYLPLTREEILASREKLEMILRNNKYHKAINDLLADFLESNEGVVVIGDSEVASTDALTIAVGFDAKESLGLRMYVDRAPTSEQPDLVLPKLRWEVVHRGALMNAQGRIKDAIGSSEIRLVPKLDINQIASHPIVQHLRRLTAPLIEDEIARVGFVCDPEDIRFQSLSRLTTYSLEELFEGGNILEEYLKNVGAVEDWRGLAAVDGTFIGRFGLNEELARKVIAEQLLIISDRMRNSSVELSPFLEPTKRYDKNMWSLTKSKGDIFARNNASGELVEVAFKEITPSLVAEVIHDKLHYIHDGRADLAFGLFFKGEWMPFSVLAIAQVDREYKQNALIALGYDPDRCFDLTRLYNRVGTPLNTSSAMMASVHEYLRMKYPNVQAMFSAFMPSFANGRSMLSGGYRNPVILKTGDQMFQEREIGGKKVAVKTTKRVANPNLPTLHSRIPMLPTIELVTAFTPPRYKPLPEMEGQMIDLT